MKKIKMSWDIERENKERELFSAIRAVNKMPNGAAKKILVKSLESMKRNQRYDNRLDMKVVESGGVTIYKNGYWSKRHFPGKTYEEAMQDFMKYDYYGAKKDKGMFTVKYKFVKQGGMWTVYHNYDCVI